MIDPADLARDDSAGHFNRRFRTALVGVAVLVLLDEVVIEPPLLRLMTDAPVINVAGRQRMLSQRIAKAALALDAARSEEDRRRHSAELDEVLRTWTTAHEQLRRRDRPPSLPGANSATVDEAFDALEPSFTRIREAAARLIRDETLAAPDPAAIHDDQRTILALEGSYLVQMDRIVGLFEREARARVDWLVWTKRILTALVLVGLGGIGQFILRPATRLIERQLASLREARDVLEHRVRERTLALEAANRDLECEVRERTRADERQRTLVEQLSHVGRTTTIGEMASGLAHELNQPLGAIANYAEGCLVTLSAPEPNVDAAKAALEKILSTTLRAGQIVKRIRRFVTRHAPARERIEPNRLVSEVEEFFRDEARRRGIGLKVELASDLPWLWGDPIQIQQVLVNLVRNAFESLSHAQTPEPSVVIRTERAGADAVSFVVRDNGEGIPAERLPRVFDAYFSTRDEGMGMGLSISRTIVEGHHGQWVVESEPQVCTTFRFTLPSTGVEDAGAHGLHR